MRVAFQLQAKGHTLTLEFGKDDPPTDGPQYVDTAPTPMQVMAEPIGFRGIYDPLPPKIDDRSSADPS